MASHGDNRQGAADSIPWFTSITRMTVPNQPAARAHITPAGLMFLAITSLSWGFNWPVRKCLPSEMAQMTMRGTTGVIGAGLLAGLAVLGGHRLCGARDESSPPVMAATLNVGCWMTL